MTLEEELIRGGDAQRFIESQLFKDACQHVEASLAAQRLAVPLREVDMHTRLIVAEQVWAQFVKFFELTAQTGKMAQITLAQKATLADRARQVFGR